MDEKFIQEISLNLKPTKEDQNFRFFLINQLSDRKQSMQNLKSTYETQRLYLQHLLVSIYGAKKDIVLPNAEDLEKDLDKSVFLPMSLFLNLLKDELGPTLASLEYPFVVETISNVFAKYMK